MFLKNNKSFAAIITFVLLLNLFSPFGNVFANSNVITVAEAIANNTGSATVEGYIVGTSQTTSSLGSGVFEGPFTITTNVLIADSPNERDLAKILPVQLPSGAVRTAINLVDNPENLGKKVQLTGNLEPYFGVAGLKSVSAYEFVIESKDYVTVAEAIANNSGTATVKGYIVGTSSTSSSLGSGNFVGPFTINANVLLADSPNERDMAKILPVQLPTGAVRNAINLVDNPTNLGKLVKLTGSLEAYFGVPGLRNTSAYEFALSIRDARAMLGQTVTTEGIVNIDNGLLQAGKLSVYMEDGSAGIQIFSHYPNSFPAVREGDRISVKGTVGEYNNVTQIVVAELEIIERNQVIVPKTVTVADYKDINVAESYEGQLVTVEGYIYSVPTAYSSGGANITLIDENLNTLTIRLWESTGIDITQIEGEKWYKITAISSQFKTTYQILPRYSSDIAVAQIQKAKPFQNGTEIRARVERVVDGDTVRLTEPVLGARNVRFLNIDTLETYHTVNNELDESQMRLGLRAGDYLRTMIADGDEVILRLGEEPLDGYGRLLAEVITLDGVNTNYQMVLAGEAVTYFIWPFDDPIVEVYSDASKFAKDNQLGIWNPADPMLEYPFEFRARQRGTELYRPVGNFRTKAYVDANNWANVAPEDRVFFNTEEDAITAGYTYQP